jgi:hypothetical protein
MSTAMAHCFSPNAALALRPWQVSGFPARHLPSMTFGVEAPLKTARYIAAALVARCRHSPCRSQAAHAGPAKKKYLGFKTTAAVDNGFREAVRKVRIYRVCRKRLPFDQQRLAAETAEIGYAHIGPFGLCANVDENCCGLLLQCCPRLRNGDLGDFWVGGTRHNVPLQFYLRDLRGWHRSSARCTQATRLMTRGGLSRTRAMTSFSTLTTHRLRCWHVADRL